VNGCEFFMLLFGVFVNKNKYNERQGQYVLLWFSCNWRSITRAGQGNSMILSFSP
jgi:hypothetical protein